MVACSYPGSAKQQATTAPHKRHLERQTGRSAHGGMTPRQATKSPRRRQKVKHAYSDPGSRMDRKTLDTFEDQCTFSTTSSLARKWRRSFLLSSDEGAFVAIKEKGC